MDEDDRVPDFPPRVLGIYWTAGEEPVVQDAGFAAWEAMALLRHALAQYQLVTEDEDAEQDRD